MNNKVFRISKKVFRNIAAGDAVVWEGGVADFIVPIRIKGCGCFLTDWREGQGEV